MQKIFPQTAARLTKWRARGEVLGVLLVGSKSRGYGDELSDDDLEVLLADEAHAALSPAECHQLYFEGEGEGRRLVYDAYFTSLSDLAGKARSARDLDHWPYEAARVLFDRDGRVSAAVDAAARMDAEFRRARLRHSTVDAGVAVGRAAKTLRRGMEAPGRLLLARGAKALARLLFALEWRWVPLEHWLEPELRTLPGGEEAAALIGEALASGRPEPLRRALGRLEDRLADEGIPRAGQRVELFLELIHPARAAERAAHGLD